MRRFAFLLLGLMLTACHAQVKPSTETIVLTWDNWTGCTAAAPCAIAVSRAPVASGASCPVTTGTLYALVTTTGATSPATYTDTTIAPGTSYCYIVQTQQAGLTSQPSSPSNVIAVPPLPLAPSIPGTTVQTALGAQPPEPRGAVVAALHLTATRKNGL